MQRDATPKAGERYLVRGHDGLIVCEATGGAPLVIAAGLTEADAAWLANGPAVRAALDETESLMEEASLMEPCRPDCCCCREIIRDRKACLAKLRAALAAVRPAG
jgi:hypothetical protein